jgi:hypothetical protein
MRAMRVTKREQIYSFFWLPCVKSECYSSVDLKANSPSGGRKTTAMTTEVVLHNN